MPALRISVKNSRELQGTIAALKTMPAELSKWIRQVTKAEMQPEWKRGLAEHARTRLDHRVLVDTARMAVSNQNVSLKSASVGRSLSGGLQPKVDYAAVEFGVDRSAVTTYEATSRKGKRYKVTRHTRRQLPPRIRNGRVVYPTASDLIPRLASLWVQTTVKTFYQVWEKAAGK
jgi:hypothetical protein